LLRCRLLVWYSIVSILFRCPATIEECDSTSPPVCKPYFQLKRTVAPHLEPYYEAYAAPYVQLVQPYYETVDQKVITPGWKYAKQYGAPRVEQAQAFSKAQWEKAIQPQIIKCQQLAKQRYNQSIGPHVNQVSTTVGPYYEIARTNALQTYHDFLLPSYQYVKPYVQHGYLKASAFATSTAVPSALWAWNKTYVFLDGTIWPQIRVIYVENVEPQLVKIGQRLGRHSTGKKAVPKPPVDISSRSASYLAPALKQSLTRPSVSAVKSVSSFIKPTRSTPTTTMSSTASQTQSSAATIQAQAASVATESVKTKSHADPVPPPEIDEALEKEDPVRKTAREMVTEDLKDWQERYSKAADEGAAEINESVAEICKKMVRRNAHTTGKGLLEQLQTSTVTQLVQLRRDILQIIGAVGKESITTEQGQEHIVEAVRRAGKEIKERAQNVRTWRERYESEMQAAITEAARDHFSILADIRDLALQKIGMKWAWTDGVTYKDWAKFHLLKSRFEEWKDDLEKLIVSHPSLEAAQEEGAAIEDEAMNLAASAARELARLKQVAGWKLTAGDDSDEFDSTLMQQAAEAVEEAKRLAADAAQNVKENVQAAGEAVSDKVQDGAEYVADTVSGATEAAKGAKDSVVDKAKDSVQPQVSEASESAESFASDVSESAASAYSAGKETINSLSSKASASAQDAATDVAESASVASEELSSVVEPTSETAPPAEQVTPDLASSAILEETPVFVGNTTELKEDGPFPAEIPVGEEIGEPQLDVEELVEDHPVSSATSTVKSPWLGAAAQSVPTRQPVLDDEEDDGILDNAANVMEALREDVHLAYSAAMSRASEQYSQALSVVSVQVHGTPEPAHEKLLASVTSAYSLAMASASSQMDNALKAASGQIYGKPTTTKYLQRVLPTSVPIPSVTMPSVEWAAIESLAAERLNQGRSWAEEQYESAKIAVGLATPTPSTPAEHVNRMLDNAKHNYYAGLGVAHERYSQFLSAASSALSSMTAEPTPTDLAGSASSVASVARESASSAAAAAAEAAASATSLVGENVGAAAESASSVAAAAAESASSLASVATAQAASAASIASAQAASAASAASERAASAGSAASEKASSIASVVSENASSVVAAGQDGAAAAADKVQESWEAIVSRISVQVYGQPTPTPWYMSAYSAVEEYAASASDMASEGAASVTSVAGSVYSGAAGKASSAASVLGESAASVTAAAGSYVGTGAGEAEKRFVEVRAIVSELLVGKEPTFSESVLSRLQSAYATGVPSVVESATDKVASVASEATEAVKEKVEHLRDEL